MSVEKFLDDLDHVIQDYETSPDAMRWTPDPVPVPDVKGYSVPASHELFDEVDWRTIAVYAEDPSEHFDPVFRALLHDLTARVREWQRLQIVYSTYTVSPTFTVMGGE